MRQEQLTPVRTRLGSNDFTNPNVLLLMKLRPGWQRERQTACAVQCNKKADLVANTHLIGVPDNNYRKHYASMFRKRHTCVSIMLCMVA